MNKRNIGKERSKKPIGDGRRTGAEKRTYSGDRSSKPATADDKKRSKAGKPFRDDKTGKQAFGGRKGKSYTDKTFKEKGIREGYGKPKADKSFKKEYKKPYPRSTGIRENDFNEGHERKSKTINYGKPYKKKEYKPRSFSSSSKTVSDVSDDGLVRLNKYLANTGICSRREADELIKAGTVTVNGVVVTELGTKIDPTMDTIHYGGQLLRSEKLRYVLLNKPKDYITTTDDPQERRTIMELIKDACKERIYPVGRLDRATTGLLLITNDGELTKRLTHPRYEIKKIYHVELDKNLKQADLEKIREGMELEDGLIKVDEISYTGQTKKEVGVEIHSGRNRIVRRIFESLGYKVNKLDRVYFGGLTKKDLPRGRWRLLSEMEVNMLKMLTGSKKLQGEKQ